MKRTFFTIITLSFIAFSCKNDSTSNTEITTETHSTTSAQSLEPTAFVEKLKSTANTQLLDVRTPKEFESQHLDSAINIDFNDANFAKNAQKLDKTKPTFVYCLSGGRSAQAATKLNNLGFKNVYEMEGGIMKYNTIYEQKNDTKTTGLTKAAFEKLIATDKKVLVDFNATWCGPCKKMAPYLDKMKDEYKNKGITIIKIDVDENETLSAEMKIDGIPHLMLFEKGKKTWENIGYITEEELKKHL